MQSHKVADREKNNDSSRCGFWIFNFDCMQKLASKKVYVLLYGLAGCLICSRSGYFNGTLTSLEKQFKISSTNIGVISSGFEISALLTALFLCYYASKQHRPRIMALALLLSSIGWCIFGMIYVIYGPGQDAIALTTEYGSDLGTKTTFDLLEEERRKSLCFSNKTEENCETGDQDSSLGPQAMLYVGNIVTAAGDILFNTLGIAYLDDNVRNDKSPFLVSLTNFIRMLGIPFGLVLASYCLKTYVAPEMHPTIVNSDPRWIGAWWMGWFMIAFLAFVLSGLFVFFPRVLPRAATRKAKISQEVQSIENPKASFKDYKEAALRLVKNKVLMFNCAAGVFYMFGYEPFYRYQSKYLEVQYNVSASRAAIITGSVSLGFFSFGLLVSGLVISKVKPSARSLAAWNIFTSIMAVTGIIAYSFFGCDASKNSEIVENSITLSACNANCMCDIAKYSPVCGSNNQTYLSPCHAGCTEENALEDGTKTYLNCACIFDDFNDTYGSATSGSCPIDCSTPLIFFVVILCLNKFIAGTEGTANFMIGMRCIEQRDKVVCLGLYEVVLDLLVFIPSPIVFGAIIDRTCVLWGKTCSTNGNCWLYNGDELKYSLNFTAAAFIIVGTCLDVGTWYHSKDVKIFDDPHEKEIKELKTLVEK